MNLNKNPLVSVIVLTFNYGKYLNKCLESIEGQSIKDMEIILVDDGSNDKYTIDYLDNLKDQYLILSTQNTGPSFARNIGMTHARGKYIIFVDADDYLDENYFELALEKLSNTGADFFYPSFQNFGEFNSTVIVPNFSKKRLLLNNFIIIESLIKKDRLLENNIIFDNLMKKGLEDRDFWINCTSKGLVGITLQSPLVFIRRHPRSRTIGANYNKNKIFNYIYTKHKVSYKRGLSSKQIFLMKAEYYFGGKLGFYINKFINIIPKKIRHYIKGV